MTSRAPHRSKARRRQANSESFGHREPRQHGYRDTDGTTLPRRCHRGWAAQTTPDHSVPRRRARLPFGELDDVVLAYSATLHKSQGSEYPAVVIPELTRHYTMLQRNLLYTAVTRGKSSSCWSARRRPSPSQSATSPGAGAGRSSRSCWRRAQTGRHKERGRRQQHRGRVAGTRSPL